MERRIMSDPSAAPLIERRANTDPIAAKLVMLDPPHAIVAQLHPLDPPLPARTTTQEDLTTASQRKVNLIWEYTQAIVALMVVAATMVAGLFAMYHPSDVVQVAPGTFTSVAVQVPTILSVAFGTVVGFYFSRTNHAAIGGIGPKPEGPYLGR